MNVKSSAYPQRLQSQPHDILAVVASTHIPIDPSHVAGPTFLIARFAGNSKRIYGTKNFTKTQHVWSTTDLGNLPSW